MHNELIIYDIWTMEKYGHKLTSKHQIVAVKTIQNQMFFLNIDQKIVFINFEFLNNTRYLKIENQEVKTDGREELITKIEANSVFLHIPFRSHLKPIDEIITLQDYNLNVYRHLVKVADKLIFISKTMLFSIEADRLFNTDVLLKSSTFADYTNQRPSLVLRFDFTVTQVWLLEQAKVLVLLAEDQTLNFLPIDIFHEFKMPGEGFEKIGATGLMEEWRFNQKWRTSTRLAEQIINIFESEGTIHLRTEDANKHCILSHNMMTYSYDIFESRTDTKHESDTSESGLIGTIFKEMSSHFQQMISLEKLILLFKDLKLSEDTCQTTFVGSLDNELNISLVVVTKNGKILLVPLLAAIFDETIAIDFKVIDTGLKDLSNVKIVNGRLMFTSGCLFHYWTGNEKDWELKSQLEVENTVGQTAWEQARDKNSTEPITISKTLSLRLLTLEMSHVHRKILNGDIRSTKSIRPLYQSSKVEALSKIILIELSTQTLEILDLSSGLFYLEDHSYDGEFVTALYDDQSSFLTLYYDDCTVEIFRFELESIRKIISMQQQQGPAVADTFSERLSPRTLLIQNLIKEHTSLLDRLRLTVEQQGLLRKLLKAYFHSYLEFNSLRWLSQAEFLKLDRTNLLLSYHLRSFYNYLNATYNDLAKVARNSEAFMPQYHQVFGEEELRYLIAGGSTRSSSLSRSNTFDKRQKEAVRASSLLDDKARALAQNLEITQYHNYLFNIFRDRFALLRDRLSTLPSHFLTEKSRDELNKILSYRFAIKDTKEELFKRLFCEFFRDDVNELITGKNGNSGYCFQFWVENSRRPAFSSIASYECSERGEWNKQFLSLVFPLLLESPSPRLEPVFLFAKTNQLRLPFMKYQYGCQGLGSTLTIIEPATDSSTYRSKILDGNFNLRLSQLTSIAGFLVFASGLITQPVVNSLTAEFLEQLVLKRNSQMNVFLLVLYFFNDDLQLSASSQFLLNVFTKNIQTYKSKLQAAAAIKEELKSLYSFSGQGEGFNPPSLSKIDLTFLMTTFVLLPQSEWVDDEQIVRVIFWVLNFVE